MLPSTTTHDQQWPLVHDDLTSPSYIQFSNIARSIEFVQSFLYFSGPELSTDPGRITEFCVDSKGQAPSGHKTSDGW